MAYKSKKIICLAKSRKTGGFCIAGKEILESGAYGSWIRPVSFRETDEISSYECQYQNKYQPDLLDIIEVPIKKHQPKFFQCENYLINEDYYWSKEGDFKSKKLVEICDTPITLWALHSSSWYGVRDRVEECSMDNLVDSLYLITPDEIYLVVQTEGESFGTPRRRVRARFVYNNVTYLFPITDPSIEKRYKKMEDGAYPFDNPKNRVFMCVSIGLPYNNYCYKFVASIIEK